MQEEPSPVPHGSAGPVASGSAADLPECLVCGACCFSELLSYVRVTGDDYERLGDAAEELVHFDGTRAYMNMSDGHCRALDVHAVSGELRCTIYASRPQICRELARGSGECRAERDVKSERPLLALRAGARPAPIR